MGSGVQHPRDPGLNGMSGSAGILIFVDGEDDSIFGSGAVKVLSGTIFQLQR